MTFADVLLWIAGVSWFMTAIAAIQRARSGDRSLLAYLGSVAVVAIPLCVAFPLAVAWILGLLWVVALVIPGLLLRRLQSLMLMRRLTAANALARLLMVLQPIGPYAISAKLSRYQCLRELGRNEEAESVRQSFGRLTTVQQGHIRLFILWIEQRWPEMLDLLKDRPAAEAGPFRIRARAEMGDIPGMLADYQAIAGVLEGQRIHQRHVLTILLAFGGQQDLCDALMADSAPEIRAYWLATAAWANGDEERARQMLDGIRVLDQPCLNAAVSWRLSHPPVLVSALDAATREQIACVAEVAERSLALAVGRPWITWVIMAICVVLFGFTATAPNDIEALWYAGAFDPELGWAGNSWRFIASAFLHVNVVHLVMNGVALAYIAPGLERTLRWWRFLVLYLGAAIGGMALVQVCWSLGDGHPELVVGASASIMGLIGADLVRIYRDRTTTEPWWRHPQIRRIGWILAIQVAFDLSHPTVSQAGHIGGFLIGFGLAWLLVGTPSVGDGTA